MAVLVNLKPLYPRVNSLHINIMRLFVHRPVSPRSCREAAPEQPAAVVEQRRKDTVCHAGVAVGHGTATHAPAARSGCGQPEPGCHCGTAASSTATAAKSIHNAGAGATDATLLTMSFFCSSRPDEQLTIMEKAKFNVSNCTLLVIRRTIYCLNCDLS